MAAYYNEWEPFAAQWLRLLIKAGHLPTGDVDERSILDVRADDLKGYAQCHFFAGIGGWGLALRIAGWDDNRPVWTGSCPCQPFSQAGKQKGEQDERHLWPIWFRLIAECRPTTVFGEQVANAITHGWWDNVASDMEKEDYSCGAAILRAYNVGKQHKRDRLFFVSNDTRADPAGRIPLVRRNRSDEKMENYRPNAHVAGALGDFCGMVDGLSSGMAKNMLRGIGNAIVPQVAAKFIQAIE